jgi:hypothetical protein
MVVSDKRSSLLWLSVNVDGKEVFQTCGLYYKSFMIVIYNCNDSTIVIYDRNDSGLYYKSLTIINYGSEEHNLGS